MSFRSAAAWQTFGNLGADVGKGLLANQARIDKLKEEAIRNQQEQERIGLEQQRINVTRQQMDPEYASKYEKAIALAKTQANYQALKDILQSINEDEKVGKISPQEAQILRRSVDPYAGQQTYRPARGLDILSADPNAKDQSGNPINPFRGWVKDKFNDYYVPTVLPGPTETQMGLAAEKYDKLLKQGMSPEEARVQAWQEVVAGAASDVEAKRAGVQLRNDIMRKKLDEMPERLKIARMAAERSQGQLTLARYNSLYRADMQEERLKAAARRFAEANYPNRPKEFYDSYVDGVMNTPEMQQARQIREQMESYIQGKPTSSKQKANDDPLGILGK